MALQSYNDFCLFYFIFPESCGHRPLLQNLCQHFGIGGISHNSHVFVLSGNSGCKCCRVAGQPVNVQRSTEGPCPPTNFSWSSLLSVPLESLSSLFSLALSLERVREIRSRRCSSLPSYLSPESNYASPTRYISFLQIQGLY